MSQHKKWPDNYIGVQQNSPEWLTLRCGMVTSSRVGDVVKKLKRGGYSKERSNYMMDKLTEVLTGRTTENYVSMAMDFGIENEPLARTVYEIAKDVEVDLIGFVKHPSVPRSGASPDGLVGEDGLVEIKVPNTGTHLEYFIAGIVPDEYKPQMMWQMACTGRAWCDFVSYDPRLPQEFGLLIVRYERDEQMIAEMEREVTQFIVELNAMCEKLQASKRESGPAPERAEIPDASEWIGRT
jgi:putative phage-type endonuclease